MKYKRQEEWFPGEYIIPGKRKMVPNGNQKPGLKIKLRISAYKSSE